ncbi:bHLH/Zip transcription factor [Exophiala dermatitidis]|uniref:BHLH domain-containing protein n=2 Tax=Exophiala dermatitidis TaxID=5970 RepID=H6BQY7_EXODN|nr:uncharacterized protein HMPREF1120_02080 [Exophiala dermatitidis NIH/UT8656]KAJ4515744.1 bHLH/Zip transcription factor [Exophiala dermatitidis]EHY53900.1 hypothetical protein HMPREF1120_02080 [Exophiala dermatitidis NIH/UT8656]KAJ4519433.1 bHLH/Zip transcription factor [Exophiala dermatitidis]KAJ4529249.1 bHLH/Zip transcription factor [Exophiala dermatitidis]KAJ4544100.1 bHLH/Zip transcription factor [Exophiala dermatitidis]
MPYSQMFPQYQDSTYENQPQQWDEVDFTTIPPSGDNYNKPMNDASFYDINNVPSDIQNPPSPNFSQFLNFDTSDVGSYSIPSEEVSPDNVYRTSPNPLDPTQQLTNPPLKIEPGLNQNEFYPCGLTNVQGEDCLPQQALQQAGPESACVQMAGLPEIEDCNAASCVAVDPNSLSTQNYGLRQTRSYSGDAGRPAAKVKGERGEKKPRGKRGNKASSSEDESAQLRAKQAHSVVERRYRDNLNGKIMQLHRALIAAESTSRLNGKPTQDFFASREHRAKVRKSDVMTDAMNYVHQSEVEMRHMSDEITRLNDRVRALEKLVKCEDCTLLKQMVRLQIQQQQHQQHHHQAQQQHQQQQLQHQQQPPQLQPQQQQQPQQQFPPQ